MISRFFIDRPIFASVLSIVITLAGGVAFFTLPIALYPPVSPPVVQVDCNYPGASAKVVAETVAAPIEQQVNGVENMLYMSSQCTNDGSYNLSVTFKHGVDVNMAQVLVQNRVNLAVPMLPDVVKQTGVITRKRSPDILMAVALTSPDDRYDQLYLSNYATLRLKDELARLPGVSDIHMLGTRDYSMRVWLDPEKLAARDLTAGDVVRALREQNAQVAAGQVGQQPMGPGQMTQITLSTLGRLVAPEQFANVVIKAAVGGRVIRVKDVGRVELGAKNQDVNCRVDGRPTVSMAIFQFPDANALDTAVIVRTKMAQLEKDFPPGLKAVIRYDTTPYIRESIGEVFVTLEDAIILVAVVVLVFLQNWRSAIIPLIAVPVAIVGTFAAMAGFGFTLNNLTLFGLVLAIGIVVDDAIVVVEAVEHHIEQGLGPRAATIRAMEQVSGPVIAVGLVLSAVFIPCAFISGITGQFFRQFALTIAVSTIISAFNSLTLSPALTALLLRPRRKNGYDVLPRLGFVLLLGVAGYEWLAPRILPWLQQAPPAALVHSFASAFPLAARGLGILAGMAAGWILGKPLNYLLGAAFAAFDAAFHYTTNLYVSVVGKAIRATTLVLLLYGGMLLLTYWGFERLPKGFIPSQDMGYLLINVQLPDSASAERTRAVMDKVEKISVGTTGVNNAFSIAGQSFLLSAFGSNLGSMFIILEDFKKRAVPEQFTGADAQLLREECQRKHIPLRKALGGEEIANRLRAKFKDLVPEATVSIFPPPPVRGVGRAGGFRIMIEDRRGDLDLGVLQGQCDNLVEKGNALQLDRGGRNALVGLVNVFSANAPQIFVDVNRKESMALGVSLRDVSEALQVYLGSLYVNDFNLFGRTWQVVAQADARFRNQVEEVQKLKVRNAQGGMVPLGTVAAIKEIQGPLILTRYNMRTAAGINGSAAKGVSSGQAIALMQQLAEEELPPGMAYEWTDLSYLELLAGNTALVIFGFSVVFVFLVLAAQYESWSLPLAVILVVPLCLLSAMAGVAIAKMDIDIFTQIGIVVLVGLASKNAVLIVEFAKRRRESGVSRRAATLEACKLRLRPIIMTSVAFILGVVPLLLSHGAGAEMRRTLGTTVFAGMLGVTAFGVFLTPVFFVVIDHLSETKFFGSPRVRQAGRIAMAILTLGLKGRAREAKRRPAEPEFSRAVETIEQK